MDAKSEIILEYPEGYMMQRGGKREMQNKRGVAIAALIAVASLVLLLSGVSAWASVTLYVDDDNAGGTEIGIENAPYGTISKALKEAKAGDTIIVAPGNYNESLTITVNDLRILGPNAGVPAGVNPGDRKGEAIIGRRLDIAANKVVFDGFTVRAAGITVAKGKGKFGSKIVNTLFVGSAGGKAISLKDSNPSVIIENNFFYNWNIGIDSTESRTLSITGNAFWYNTGYGVKLSGSTLSKCSENAFRDNNVGFYAQDVKGELALRSNSFQGNTQWAVENGDKNKPKPLDINARKNWWGDVSGPAWAGPGSGDRISRKVLFYPWLGYDPCGSLEFPALPPAGNSETSVIDETLQSQGVKPGQKNVVVQQVVIKDPATGTASDRYPTDIYTAVIRIDNGRRLLDRISLVVDSNKNGILDPGEDTILAYRTTTSLWQNSVTFGVPGKKLLQVPDKGEVRLFVVVDISPTSANLRNRISTRLVLTAQDGLSSPGSVSSQFSKNSAKAYADTVVAFASGDKEANLIDETKGASIINGQQQAVIQEFVLQDPDGGADITADNWDTRIDTVTVRSTAGSTITAEDIVRMWIVEETDGIPGYSNGDSRVGKILVAGRGIDLELHGARFGEPSQLLVRVNNKEQQRFYIVADFKDTLKDGDWLKTEITVTASDYQTSQKSSDIENPVLIASNGVVMGAASGSGIPQVKGDVNGDGKVDVSDVRLVSRFILKVKGATLTAAQKVAGDVAPPHIPPDTNLDVTDVRWISQAALGLKTLSAKTVNVGPLAMSTPAKLKIDEDGRLNVSGTTSALADLQGRLLFDPAVLHVSEVIGLNGFTVLASTIDNDKGEVRFIVANLSIQPVLGKSMIQFVTSGDPTQAVVDVEVLRDVYARNVPYQFLGLLSDLEFSHVPNPITDVHTARFGVKGAAAALVEAIKVQIFDLSGRLVYEDEEAGASLAWHTDSSFDEYLANGVYLYKLYALVNGEWVASKTKKLAILR